MAASMRVRFELFVREMGVAVAFYTGVMGFDLVREEPGYASLRRGEVILGLGSISKLPAEGGYFTRDIAERRCGLGVESVLEVSDLDNYHARILASGYEIFEPLRERPWGLRDFRVVDPDGYYLRITSRA
jgi:lactoylglutathione lyase